MWQVFAGRQLNRDPLEGGGHRLLGRHLMDAEGSLQTLAELALAVVGFSAIVVALRGTALGLSRPAARWGLALGFLWSLAAMIFSLIPIILFYFGVSGGNLWRTSLATSGGFFFVAAMGIHMSYRRLLRREPLLRISQHVTAGSITHLLSSGFLVSTAVYLPGPGPYLCGVLIMLILSLWVLLGMLFITEDSSSA